MPKHEMLSYQEEDFGSFFFLDDTWFVKRGLNPLTHNPDFQPITRWQILDSSKLKEFADDNFKFDESGRKLHKWVENTVGKGEIAQCFQKVCFPGAPKGVIVWEWVNSPQERSLSKT